MKYFKSIKLYSLVCILILFSCKKFVEVEPPVTSTNGENVYSTDATAIAVLNGIYIQIGQAGGGLLAGATGISLYSGLSADEFSLHTSVTNSVLNAYSKNNLAVNIAGSEFWTRIYNLIFKCNAAIEGLTNSKTLTPSVKQQLLGEARFLRAFFYFYLVNFYGDLPLALVTDYSVTSVLPRVSSIKVYDQIIQDLLDAEKLLSPTYLDATLTSVATERVRPSRWSATAFLARVYLYIQDWSKAEAQSSSLISNPFFSLSTLSNAFLKSSLGNKEAIWQIQPTNQYYNSFDAVVFVIPPTGLSNNNPVFLSNSLTAAFEPGDQRAVDGNWVKSITISGNTYQYPYKYKRNLIDSSVTALTGSTRMTEFTMILRLAEQYLIRAEARAHLGNITGAQSDINIIRSRAGLTNTTASSQLSILAAIMHERQIELFTELGHRWLDLKRTNSIDDVMSIVTPQKGSTWNSFKQWYPLPSFDIERNRYLVQNEGY